MTSKQAFNQGINKWASSVQIDIGLRSLSDIKIIIERYFNENLHLDIYEIIEKIEYLCELDKTNKHLSRIKKMIKIHYETIGREEKFDDRKKKELLFNIADFVDKVKIPNNYLVISRLKEDDDEI